MMTGEDELRENKIPSPTGWQWLDFRNRTKSSLNALKEGLPSGEVSSGLFLPFTV